MLPAMHQNLSLMKTEISNFKQEQKKFHEVPKRKNVPWEL